MYLRLDSSLFIFLQKKIKKPKRILVFSTKSNRNMLLWIVDWHPPYLVLVSSFCYKKMAEIFSRSSLNCYGFEFRGQGLVCI